MTAQPIESDWLVTLRGARTLDWLYAEARRLGFASRPGDDDVVHSSGDTRAKRRLRGALQTVKARGQARHLGRRTWLLDGTPERPRHVILISLAGDCRQVELRLQRAAELLAELDGEADIVFTDPPWALGLAEGGHTDWERTQARDSGLIVPGYVDIRPEDYPAFTREWVTAAAGAIRPGGYLAVVTGPQQAARVQISAEDAGLTFVNQISVGKHFPIRTLTKFANGHWNVTVMTRGPLKSRRRYFLPPEDMVAARTGRLYPRDHWPASMVGRADARRGQARYRTELPDQLAGRVLDAFVPPATASRIPLVVDPFHGGGRIVRQAALRGYDVVAGDVNRHAVGYTAHRLEEALAAGAVPA